MSSNIQTPLLGYNHNITTLHHQAPSPPPLSPLSHFLVHTLNTPNDPDTLQRWSSFIGIVIAIAGNILISLALNIQKYAHTLLSREAARRRRRSTPPTPTTTSTTTTPLLAPEKPDDRPNPYLRSPFWWAGLILMFLGECGNFLAYGFAPASIISPLGVVALIANCVVAPLMLREPFRRRDFLGILVSIAGAVIIVWSAKKQETKLGPDELLKAITQTAFYVYVGITLTLIAILTSLSRTHGDRTIFIDLSLVALYGSYTVLSTKAISSLISSSFYRIFTYPISYSIVGVLILTAILQVKYVNRALMRFDSTIVIPTQFVLFTISVITGSAVLYGDFKTVDAERMGKFVAGCAATFVGVYLISTQRVARAESDVDEETDGEEEEAVAPLLQGVERGGAPREIRPRREGRSESNSSSLSIVHGFTGYQLSGVLAEAGSRRGSSTGPGLGSVVLEYVAGRKKKRKALPAAEEDDGVEHTRRRIE